jgi:hypothetical protein
MGELVLGSGIHEERKKFWRCRSSSCSLFGALIVLAGLGGSAVHLHVVLIGRAMTEHECVQEARGRRRLATSPIAR